MRTALALLRHTMFHGRWLVAFRRLLGVLVVSHPASAAAGRGGIALVAVLASAQVAPARGITVTPPPRGGAGAPQRQVAVAPDQLQQAIDTASPGDTLVLDAGRTYTGPFHLPVKNGNGWIVIRSSASAALASGARVTPQSAGSMPKLVSASGSVLSADAGAHHYYFVGLEIAPTSGTFLYNVVELGNLERNLADVPHDLVFDRCFIHGDGKAGSRRGIALNSANTMVRDSFISDFKEVGADSQAIAGWNGPGPFELLNNYLEGAGENVMFGGADPTIAGLVPSDITIHQNTFSKPRTWRVGDPQYLGVAWTVKNLFELKNARRVLIDGNVFEYNWVHAQNGFGILFTVRNQDGGSPWSTIEDVTFTHNIVRHVGAGINILGRDDNRPSQQTRRVLIKDNLFYDVSTYWGNGRLFQLLNGTADVTFDHNTAFQAEALLFGGDTTPHTGFVFQNNIAPHNDYGIIGSGTGVGQPSIDRYFPGSVIRRNVIVGGEVTRYPRDNFFVGSLNDIGFVGAIKGFAELDLNNFRLSGSSRYRGAGSDGLNPGVDVDALNSALTVQIAAADDAVRDLRQAQAAGVGDGGRDVRHIAAAVVFWAALGLLGYVYVGYGGVIFLRGALNPRPVARRAIWPRTTIVVVAHDEGARIAARVENLLALDYPRDRLEILVASDGSTDDTVEQLRRFEPAIRIIESPARRGKAALLNEAIGQAGGDIIALADARQRFEPSALRLLAESFADQSVGAVSGELVLLPAGKDVEAPEGMGLYWSYEKHIRQWESRVHSTVGATGAIYAIRRKLFEPIPEDTILDDVLIPLRIVRRGYRVVFEPRALAYDVLSATARDELKRKARTIGGTFQLLGRERWIWNPFRNRLWLQTLSHKALRLTVPVLHVTGLVANALMLDRPIYDATMAAQVLFYGSGVMGWIWAPGRKKVRPLVVPYTIGLLGWATIVGFVRFATGRLSATWDQATAGSPAAIRRLGRAPAAR